jgi:3-hydroxyacyl-[acyl-carrier-protein] dehydratase
MMQMVKELVESFTGRKLRLARADHLKFLTIIDPRENNLIEADLLIVPGGLQAFQVTASFFHKDTTFFKFKGGFVVE